MPIRRVNTRPSSSSSTTTVEETPIPPSPPRRVRPVAGSAPPPAEPDPRGEPDGRGYQVGFGKPPVHTRFRKGQSGNPRGRPGGTRNEKTLVAEILGKRVPVRTPEGRRHLNSFEISLVKLREKAARGDIRAIREVLAYLGKISAASEQDAASGKAMAALTPAEEQILQYLLGGGTSAGIADGEAADD